MRSEAYKLLNLSSFIKKFLEPRNDHILKMVIGTLLQIRCIKKFWSEEEND